MDSLLRRRRPRKNQVRPFKVDFGDQGKVKETEKRASGSNLRLTVWNQGAPESPNKGRLRQSSGLCSCTNQQCKAFSLSISLSLHLSLSLSVSVSLGLCLSLSQAIDSFFFPIQALQEKTLLNSRLPKQALWPLSHSPALCCPYNHSSVYESTGFFSLQFCRPFRAMATKRM